MMIVDKELLEDIKTTLERFVERHADAIEKGDVARTRTCAEVMQLISELAMPSVEGISVDVIFVSMDDEPEV